jgi:hypothetical protein
VYRGFARRVCLGIARGQYGHITAHSKYWHGEAPPGIPRLDDARGRFPGGDYCYDLSEPQKVISHGIARIAEHVGSDRPQVIAHGFTSPLLRSLGERTLRDEVRVLVHDETTTAYFTFSSQMWPQVFESRFWTEERDSPRREAPRPDQADGREVQELPVPIPYREILLTSRVMEAVFAQLADDRPAALAVPLSVRTA